MLLFAKNNKKERAILVTQKKQNDTSIDISRCILRVNSWEDWLVKDAENECLADFKNIFVPLGIEF